MSKLQLSLPVCALILSSLFIHGCRQCPTCAECPEQDTTSTAKKFVAAPGLEYPDVPLAELNCAKTDLPDHFVTSSLDPSDLRDLVHGVFVSELNGILHGLDRKTTGMKLHYGAEASGSVVELRYGIEIVEIDPRKDDVFYDVKPNNGMVHLIKPNGKLDNPIDTVKWNAGLRKAYLSNIKVFRTNDSIPKTYPDKLRVDYDRTAYIFRISDIDSLIDDNTGLDRLNIHSIAVPSVRRATPLLEEDWFHHVALVAANGSTEYLNCSPRTTDNRFTNKALDLGSPCPPSCALARFYHYGMAPRANCTCP